MSKYQHINNYPNILINTDLLKCEYKPSGYNYGKKRHFVYHCQNDATTKITTDFSNWEKGIKTFKTKGIHRDIHLCDDCLKKVMRNNINISEMSLIKVYDI